MNKEQIIELLDMYNPQYGISISDQDTIAERIAEEIEDLEIEISRLREERDEAISSYQDLLQYCKWFDVKDHLPSKEDDKEFFLVTDGEVVDIAEYYYDSGMFLDSRTTGTITHWAPLLIPPGGKLWNLQDKCQEIMVTLI